MAIKHEPTKIVSRQESGPTVRQPKPSRVANRAGFGLCDMTDRFDKMMSSIPGAAVPVTEVQKSILLTGSAFIVLSVGENGVFSRVVDPETGYR